MMHMVPHSCHQLARITQSPSAAACSPYTEPLIYSLGVERCSALATAELASGLRGHGRGPWLVRDLHSERS